MKTTPHFTMQGESIVLRYAQEEDLEAYLVLLEDPESNRLTGSQTEFTREQIIHWLKRIGQPSQDRIDLMIVSKHNNQLIGEVVINDIDLDSRRANIRIAIAGTENLGRGYGTEALKLMLHHGFETLQLHRIELSVYDFNPRAIHLYEKLGFQREGVMRDYLYQDGAYHDAIFMSLLTHEYRG